MLKTDLEAKPSTSIPFYHCYKGNATACRRSRRVQLKGNLGLDTAIMKTIGIFPASGGLGGSTVKHILQRVPSDGTILISRNPDKTRALPGAEGAVVRQAAYESSSVELERAFKDIDVLFLISYPSHVRDYRVKVQLPAIDAAKRAGVKHIFYSSLGFALPYEETSRAEVMQAHLECERYLREMAAADPGFTYTSIREGLYHESFPIYTSFWTLENPSEEIQIPHDGSGPGVSWVKRDELGEASAILIARYATSDSFEWTNKTVVLTGPKSWSLADTVTVLGRAVNKTVRIREVSVDEWIKQPQIIGYFGDETKARTWATAWEAIRAGETSYVSPALKDLLGRESESFETTIQHMAKSGS